MTPKGLTRTRENLFAIILTACLLLTLQATLIGLPAAVRIAPAVPGLLLAPGYVWLLVMDRRSGTNRSGPATATLAAVLSVAVLPLLGVLINAFRSPVTPTSIGLGVLAVTMPGMVLLLRPSGMPEPGTTSPVDGEEPRGHPRVRWRLTTLAVGLFAAAVAWGASWQHEVETGPFTEMSYAGDLAQLSGPLVVRPAAPLPIPIRLTTSDGRPWDGTIDMQVDSKPPVVQPVHSASRGVLTLVISGPLTPGDYNVITTARRDGTREVLTLTLRLHVTPI